MDQYMCYTKKDIANGFVFGHYFKTQREAKAYQAEHGGVIDRKIGGRWVKFSGEL